MNDELKQAVQSAEEALKREHNGRLSLFYRKRIWAAMGSRSDDSGRATKSGPLIRRVELATLCARRVAPIWDEVYADEEDVHELIQVASEYLDGKLTWDQAWELKNEFGALLVDLEGGPLRPYAAGRSAVKVVSTALYDEIFESPKVKKPDFEQDREPDRWDASFAASVAVSSLYWWEDGGDPVARRKFWEWYLNAGVPRAWEAA